MPDVSVLDDNSAGTPGRRALKVGLVSVVTLVAFESLAVTTILPEVEHDLGGIAWYGWVTAAFFFGTMIGIVFAGDQADRRGAGPPYLLGLVLFAAGLLVCGFAPGMPVLVVGRFVQGFGAGVVPAIGYVAIGRAFSVAERPRMFAVLSTAWVVPGLIGPVLAERIAEGIGWRWVFLGLVPLVACAGLFVLPAMFRLGPGGRRHGRGPGPVLATPTGRSDARGDGCGARGGRLHGQSVVARAGADRRCARRRRTVQPAHAARNVCAARRAFPP